MSEVKGTLLTVILALTVFGFVFTLIVSSIQAKAGDVARNISDAGQVAPPAAGAAANALIYEY